MERQQSQTEVDIQELLSNSLLVNVTVHGAGMFHTRLTLEELGIDSQQTNSRLKGGAKVLDPELDKMCNSWATQCRQLYRKHMIHLEAVDALTGSKSWNVLMLDRYEQFLADWDALNYFDQELDNEYMNGIELNKTVDVDIAFFVTLYHQMSTRQKIITKAKSGIDRIRDENSTFIANLAHESWTALQERYNDGVAIFVKGRTFGPDDKEEYVDWCVTETLAALPDVRNLEHKLFAEYATNILFTSSQLAQDKARQAEAELQETRARAEIEEIHNSAFLSNAQKQAIRQAELEKARASLTEMTSPIQEAMRQLMDTLSKQVNALLEGYKKHGTFKGRSLETAKGFTDLWQIMGGSLFGDEELASLIDDIKQRCDSVSLDREDNHRRQEGIVTKLQDLNMHIATVDNRRKHIRSRAGFLEL